MNDNPLWLRLTGQRPDPVITEPPPAPRHQWVPAGLGHPQRASIAVWGCPDCGAVKCTRTGADPYA
jgi:hypothetical protein